jgi:hypothetical protein
VAQDGKRKGDTMGKTIMGAAVSLDGCDQFTHVVYDVSR